MNKENVGDHNPSFRLKEKRAHFENPISSEVDTNPERYELTENFNQLPGETADIGVDYNLDFELVGTNASQDDVTPGAEISGILLTTDSSGTDQVIISPHNGSEQTSWKGVLWGTENQVIWEAVIRTGASISSIILWAGLKLTDDQDITADDDAVFFRFDTTNWEAVYSIGDTDVEVDTGIVVATATEYYFRIEIDSDRVAHFFINDKEVAQSTALTNDVDLIPFIGVEGASKTLYVIKEKISRIIYE